MARPDDASHTITVSSAAGTAAALGPPAQSLPALFLRFLKFGALAWGGPVAQIAMIRQELVEEERWVSREHFNRILAVYQVLPGPEAHELCVYFGTLARGRVGGLLAGLGFMLPGFVLMLTLSALYAAGLTAAAFRPFFLGVQPAVVALIFRAVHRIGAHALSTRWLWAIGAAAAVAQLAQAPFWATLSFAGLANLLATTRRPGVPSIMPAMPIAAMIAVAAALTLWAPDGSQTASVFPGSPTAAMAPTSPSVLHLFASGLRAGLLTFGGAYTVLPFLQRDAVVRGAWMSPGEFLDGVALSGILPAPFIIFATFVGYAGGGPAGAVALTAGVFLPAFAFTLLAHQPLERAVQRSGVHAFLEGVTAGVVGLIAVTALNFLGASVRSGPAVLILIAALVGLYRWRAKGAVAVVILTAGAIGLLIF